MPALGVLPTEDEVGAAAEPELAAGAALLLAAGAVDTVADPPVEEDGATEGA